MSHERVEALRAPWDGEGFLSGTRLELARDLIQGFSREPKQISSRWFYDNEGSRLFSRIMDLPEYYPTLRETEIFTRFAERFISAIGGGPLTVVELGAGDGRKTSILLRSMYRGDVVYRPIDCSRSVLETLCENLKAKLPGLRIQPICDENDRGLSEVTHRRGDDRLLVLFLGSSIGNFNRTELTPFLNRLRGYLRRDDLVLIGFDLIKDVSRLIRAYSDMEGVTRAFNLNLLTRINRDLKADFACPFFQHEAIWNPRERAMESWLFSRRDQWVNVGSLGRSYRLRKWEGIHTETSLKFEHHELNDLAFDSGFEPVLQFEDRAGDFADVLWRAE